MASPGVEHPEHIKVTALHRTLVLGQVKADVCRDLGVSVASLRIWSKIDRLVAKARALVVPAGATAGPPPPPEPPPGPDWALEPIDADPLDPGPITRRILAAAYRLTTRLDTLDDLVRWPRGTAGLWFEDAEGDAEGDAFGALRAHLEAAAARPSVELVRELRRARALVDLELIERAVECGKGAFMAMALLKSRRPAEYDPEQRDGDEAEDPLGDYSDADLDRIIEAGRR